MRSELRIELLRRAEHDQAARAELLRRAEQDAATRAEPEPDWDTVASVDADNLTWLKDVVAELGWPESPMVVPRERPTPGSGCARVWADPAHRMLVRLSAGRSW